MSDVPNMVIDSSKQNDSATASLNDIRIELEGTENLTGVTAYCLNL